jgi:pseudouridylate synthase
MAPIRISPEVADALAGGAPVVALESTVLAHGLPRPENLEVGRSLEREIRDGGAVPATIALIDGVPTVGLSEAELGRIAGEDDVDKLSTRDLPLAMARGRTGATTVAATAWIAARAGIQVFSTGGIGGVHRGYPADVSADLPELQRSSLIVVCSGAKSILDLAATREALETLGVLVLGWRTDTLPAFYAPSSGLPVDGRVDTAREVAEVWRSHRELGAPGALLLCAPVPDEQGLTEASVEEAIRATLAAAEEKGVRGKHLTPYLLRGIAEATGGRSLEANVALLRNNARIGAGVAVAL